MTRKLKVYAGLTFENGKQVSTIIATTSMKKASELVGESYSCIRDYWSITGNKISIEVAMSRPDIVFKASHSMGKDFKPVEDKK